MNGIIQGSNEPIELLVDGVVDDGYDIHAVLKWENRVLKEWSADDIQVEVNGNESTVTLALEEADTISFPDVTARLLLKWGNTDTGYAEFMSITEIPIIKYDDDYRIFN